MSICLPHSLYCLYRNNHFNRYVLLSQSVPAQLKCFILIQSVHLTSQYFPSNNKEIIRMQVGESLKALKCWRVEESKAITAALTKLSQAKSFKDQELDGILEVITNFHKEITKAKEDEIQTSWYQFILGLKKKLKKMQEAFKEKTKKAMLQKKPAPTIVYPESLTIGKRPNDQLILKSLYKNFATNCEEAIKSPQTVPFIQHVLRELKEMYEDKPDEAFNKRINSICLRLARESSKEAKLKMLAAKISPLELAKDNEEIYFDEKTKETIKKNQLAQLQASQTGFYDKMKRDINKDACEECRYCHKNNAFCEDMKQIRASDQPMTRFMRCNACSKTWRD